MRMILKILSVLFALATLGQLMAGKFWPIGIVLAVVCGFFGFWGSGDEEDEAEKEREELRDDLGLSEETPDDLLDAARQMKEGDTEGAMDMMRKNENPAEYYFNKGKDLAVWEDDYKSAIELFTKGIELGDTKYLPHFYSLRADSRLKLGNAAEALEDIEAAVDILDEDKPVDMARFIERRAEIKREIGRIEEAKVDEKKAEEIREGT